MPDRPLAGRAILVTRPAGQAESLCAALAAAGAEAPCYPLLSVAPLADPAPLHALARRLGDFDLAFFVSPNAVRFALDALLPVAPWPASLAVATVGKGSEAALAARGFSQVIAPQSGFDSESVLALPAFQAEAVAGKRVLILRGDGGRELIGDTLLARGARVEYQGCYHRGGPQLDPAPIIERARSGRLDALTLTSSEAAGHLAALPQAGVLLHLPVFASHPRIAQAARDVGCTQVIQSGPGDAGLMEALIGHFRRAG